MWKTALSIHCKHYPQVINRQLTNDTIPNCHRIAQCTNLGLAWDTQQYLLHFKNQSVGKVQAVPAKRHLGLYIYIYIYSQRCSKQITENYLVYLLTKTFLYNVLKVNRL